jgi:two-component system alkaline phosphatase synthesis response regulator PhoP
MVMTLPIQDAHSEPQGLVTLGNLSLNLDNYRVVVGDEVVDLTYSELELLQLFFSQPDRVIPYEELTRVLWASEERGSIRHLNVLVHRLRNKLVGSDTYVIETVRGRGYGLLKSREAEVARARGGPPPSNPPPAHKEVS